MDDHIYYFQIMYMYYLLGYKLTGTGEEKDVIGESNRKKNPFARSGTSLLNHLKVEKVKRVSICFFLLLLLLFDIKTSFILM